MISAILLSLATALLVATVQGWSAFGKTVAPHKNAALRRSPQWRSGKFKNVLPLRNFALRSVADAARRAGRHKVPDAGVRVYPNDGRAYQQPPAAGLRVTWLGHSTVLLEIDGATLLIDPVWGQRTSPWRWLGPRRWYEPPLSIEQLPPLDAVLVSHDHYDHLCRDSIVALKNRVDRFIVPLGVGAHLEYWGIRPANIEELDWWDDVRVGDIRVTATPAGHASGRHLFDLNRTLWMGFALRGTRHNVYFSGDSGLFPGFKEIGERLGPFDLAMIEIGAYSRNWPDWHMGPEQAVIANQWVQAKRLLPVHWGLFNLALHNWTEPVERVLAASAEHNLAVLTPMPGQPLEPGVTDFGRWWPELPWQRAEQHTVRSSGVDLEHHEIGLINGAEPERIAPDRRSSGAHGARRPPGD